MGQLSRILLGGSIITLTVLPLPQYNAIWPLYAAVILSIPNIVHDVRARGFGPRLIWAAFGLLLAPALAHAVITPSVDNTIGFFVLASLPPLYLAARAHGPRLWLIFPITAIIEAVYMLVLRAIDPHPSYGGFMSIAHYSCFVIVCGMMVAREGRLKWALWTIGPAAILVSGSEEGLLFLATAAGAVVWRRWFDAPALAALVSILITLAIILPTGHFTETHHKLTAERFESIGDATNHRSTGISDNIGMSWIVGDGWHWDTQGGIHQTVHNAPLKMMSQYGIPAAAGVLAFLLWGFMRHPSDRRFCLAAVVLSAAMVDHFLVDLLLPWPFFMAGLYVSESLDKHLIVARAPKRA